MANVLTNSNFIKMSLYAVGDRIFLEEELTVWEWESTHPGGPIIKGRKRLDRIVNSLPFNVRVIGEDDPVEVVQDSTNGFVLTQNNVFAQNGLVHFQNEGYIQILPPIGAEGATAGDPKFRESRFPQAQPVTGPNSEIVNSTGRNIYIEAEFSATPPAGQTLSPLLFHEQPDEEDPEETSILLLAENQNINRSIFWKIFDTGGIWSDTYQINGSNTEYLLTVNLDRDKFFSSINSPTMMSPYFELLADSIPIMKSGANGSGDSSDLLNEGDSSDLMSPGGPNIAPPAEATYPFYLGKYPYIGYTNVKPNAANGGEPFLPQEYAFHGQIKRLDFDPNAVCPC